MPVSDLYCFCPDRRLAVRRRIQTGSLEGREYFGCSKYGSGNHCRYFSLVERFPVPAGKRPFCHCSKPALLKSANTDKNKDREFYTCGTTEHCKFFKWFDVFAATVVEEREAPSIPTANINGTGGLSPHLNPEISRCKCGNFAAIKVASTTKNKGREFYVCSSRCCDYFRWRDECKGQKRNILSNSTFNEQEHEDSLPNEYALQSEESIRKDIEKLQTSLNDKSLLANLPDRGERMRLKLDKLSDALVYKEKHPDPTPLRPESSIYAKFEASLKFSDEPKRTNDVLQGADLHYRAIKPSLDLRMLEESLARKSNVKNVVPSEMLKSKLYPHQQLCFNWMYERERDDKNDRGPRGGIVADDMGLGKTIQMIALMLSSIPSEFDLKRLSSQDRIRSKSTLIVCPLAVASQWCQEIRRHTVPDSLSVHIHHGKDQLKIISESAKFDVVITTYQTALSSFKQNGMLHTIHWFRIILDEAHVIKNHNTATAKAVFDLESQTRWLMTATPLQNHIQDMFSVFKFLRYAPFCEEEEWNRLFESQSQKSVKRLRPVLQGIMIRRTKEDKDEDGNPLIRLPPKHIEVYRLKFREEDKKWYDQVDKDCHKAFYDDRQLLVRIIRLRQACNCMTGPIARSSDIDNSDNPATSSVNVSGGSSREAKPDEELATALNKLSIVWAKEHKEPDRTAPLSETPNEHKDDQDELTAALSSLSIHSKKDNKKVEPSKQFSDHVCASCSDLITEQPIFSNGCHRLCIECISAALNGSGKCPACGKKLPSEARLKMGHSLRNDARSSIGSTEETDLKYFRESPKMDFLIRNLNRIRRTSQEEKAVIFSQWTTMLDLVELCLHAEGIRSVRIDGSMTRKDREKSIDDFHNNADINVFLLSLKCAGIGLNLTVANHCFMLDTWWNYSIEDQAFCRIYRIGQTRPVHIYRLIIEDTIEERVLALQHRKQKLVDSLITSDGAALKTPEISVNNLRALLLE